MKTIEPFELEKIEEQLRNSISILSLMETDLSTEDTDGVYYGAVKVVHSMLSEAKKELENLILPFPEVEE